jgi:hypothetical protein
LARVVALLALLMLPVQLRAGTDEPHPHALLQIILDASDGVIDHHAAAGASHGQDEVKNFPAESRLRALDSPSIGESIAVASGLAMIAVLVSLLCLSSAAEPIWPIPMPARGRLPTLDPPPPRHTV